jgi:hypothetical protein
MSTYAVFGMTRPRAVEMARKSISDNVNEMAWNSLVNNKADEIMESRRCVMLSDKFDAPQFAEDYRNLARSIESRDLCIKAQCKTGDFTKKGRPKMHWVSTA